MHMACRTAALLKDWQETCKHVVLSNVQPLHLVRPQNVFMAQAADDGRLFDVQVFAEQH